MTSRLTTVRTHFAYQRYLVSLLEDSRARLRLHVCLLEAARLAETHPSLDEERRLTLRATFSRAAHRLVEHGDPDAEVSSDDIPLADKESEE